jgi:pimeloyl-ACP methyl ester carboxylesterase
MKDWDPKIETFIIYLHSHGSNRTEGRFLLDYASELNYNLCLLDLRGSGDSQGKFSTLGIKEYRDIYSVVKLLQKSYRAKKIVLYGRSMGAASIMKFVAEYRNGIRNL